MKPLWKIVFGGLVFFVASIIYIYIYFILPPSRCLFIKPLSKFATPQKIVALTFDDGPSAHYTPLLLDLLKKYSVHATFFLIGERIVANRPIVKKIITEGHSVGNHSYSHSTIWFRSRSFIENDINKMDSLFLSLGLSNVPFFRPPYGKKMVVLPLVLKKLNKTLVTWNINPPFQFDLNNTDFRPVAQYVIDHCQPGSIVLLHDGWSGEPKPWLEEIERMIIGLKKKSFRFVTIQEGLDLSNK